MESKEEMYLRRAEWASNAANWAEDSRTGEVAALYRRIAMLWHEMAVLAKRWPANPV
jgi:hypothetical protein